MRQGIASNLQPSRRRSHECGALKSLYTLCPAVEWNLANWDLYSWLENMAPAGEGGAARNKGLFSKNFHNYNAFHVYRYTYNEKLAYHGGVKITYKDRLSTKGTADEAEWLPITRILRDGPGGSKIEANVTTDDGLIIIPRPPDLRFEPFREEWNSAKDETAGPKAIEAILKHRSDSLKPASLLEWRSLLQLHQTGSTVVKMPNLPHMVEVTGDESTKAYLAPGAKSSRLYEGTPMLLKPILRALCEGRFRRRLINWDIWGSEPPDTFPTLPAASSSAEGPDGELDDEVGGLRDPRLANVVTDETQPPAERKKGAEEARQEEWAEAQNSRVAEVEEGELYLAQLEIAEGELYLGLCRAKMTAGKLEVWWYQRCGKHFAWASSGGCAFKQWVDKAGAWLHDELDPKSILLHVTMKDLTPGGLNHCITKPVPTKEFLERVRLFAKCHHNKDNGNMLLAAAPEGAPPRAGPTQTKPKARATSSIRPDAAPMAKGCAAAPAGAEAESALRSTKAKAAVVAAELSQLEATKKVQAANVRAQRALAKTEKVAAAAAAQAGVAEWAAGGDADAAAPAVPPHSKRPCAAGAGAAPTAPKRPRAAAVEPPLPTVEPRAPPKPRAPPPPKPAATPALTPAAPDPRPPPKPRAKPAPPPKRPIAAGAAPPSPKRPCEAAVAPPLPTLEPRAPPKPRAPPPPKPAAKPTPPPAPAPTPRAEPALPPAAPEPRAPPKPRVPPKPHAAEANFEEVYAVFKGDGILPSPPLPPIDGSDHSALRKLIGKYVMVPVAKYPKLWAGPAHLGWAAKIVGFEKDQYVVRLQSMGEKAVRHPVLKGVYALVNLVRLT